MTTWDLPGMDFDDIADMPSWAYPQLPLNERGEFTLKNPEEDEEVSLPNEMYDADDEISPSRYLFNKFSRKIPKGRKEEGASSMQSSDLPTSAQLHERICRIREQEAEREKERSIQEQHSQAKDSKRPYFLSQCPDYSQRSSLRLDKPPPRIDFAAVFRQNPQTEISSPIQSELLAIPDNEEENSDNSQGSPHKLDEISSIRQTTLVISNNTIKASIPRISEVPHRKTRIRGSSSTIHRDVLVIADNEDEETISTLPGFETMNVDELVFDNKVAPASSYLFACDIQRPKHFDLEPHWFHDTPERKCWCYHCIQHRKFQSTGKEPEKHDYNKWCLCTSCIEFWHEVLDVDGVCNCPHCKNRDKAQAISKESEAQAIWEEKKALATLQNQLQSPPSTQQPPRNLLCPDATAAASESQKLSSELFDVIRETLRYDSDE